jgi:glycosyltransferase involved in cell wall biosynthesis
VERQIQASCDLNITTNAYAKAVLEKQYRVDPKRVTAIPHHFQSDDLDGSAPDTLGSPVPDKQDLIRIGFLGTLFKPPRVPGHMIYEILRDINAPGRRVELHVHGKLPKTVPKRSLKRMRVDGLWFHGPSSHRDSLNKLAPYDFLLLLLADLPNSKAVMSIKLPHYLLMGIPILAVVPEPSAVADTVRETGSGYVIPFTSDWQDQLVSFLSDPTKLPALKRNEQAIQAYSWGNVSQRWIRVLTPAQPGCGSYS